MLSFPPKQAIDNISQVQSIMTNNNLIEVEKSIIQENRHTKFFTWNILKKGKKSHTPGGNLLINDMIRTGGYTIII